MAFDNDVHAGMNAVAGNFHRFRRFDAGHDFVNNAKRISGGCDDGVHAGLIVAQHRFVRHEQSLRMVADDDGGAAKHLAAQLGGGRQKTQPHLGHLRDGIDLRLDIFDFAVIEFFRPALKIHCGFLSRFEVGQLPRRQLGKEIERAQINDRHQRAASHDKLAFVQSARDNDAVKRSGNFQSGVVALSQRQCGCGALGFFGRLCARPQQFRSGGGGQGFFRRHDGDHLPLLHRVTFEHAQRGHLAVNGRADALLPQHFGHACCRNDFRDIAAADAVDSYFDDRSRCGFGFFLSTRTVAASGEKGKRKGNHVDGAEQNKDIMPQASFCNCVLCSAEEGFLRSDIRNAIRIVVDY